MQIAFLILLFVAALWSMTESFSKLSPDVTYLSLRFLRWFVGCGVTIAVILHLLNHGGPNEQGDPWYERAYFIALVVFPGFAAIVIGLFDTLGFIAIIKHVERQTLGRHTCDRNVTQASLRRFVARRMWTLPLWFPWRRRETSHRVVAYFGL